MKTGLFNWDDLGDLGDLGLAEEDVQQDLLGKPRSDAILGRFSLDQFMIDLEHSGLLNRLRSRGYQSFRPSLEKTDLFSERIRLFGTHVDYPEELQLMDVKSHRAGMESPWGTVYRALGWDWVEMQDPTAQSSPYRPVLPGQKHPGLGMFRSLTRLMLQYVEHLDVEALTAIPLYFHNAVLYSEAFYFLDATLQGRFLAMCRDLLHQGLAPASWWVANKEVEMVDRQTGEAQPFVWAAALIVNPMCADLRARLDSPLYRQARDQALESVEFRVCEKKSEQSIGLPGGQTGPDPEHSALMRTSADTVD